MGKIKDFLFHNRNTRQTVAKNVFWLGVGRIGSRLFRALIIIYAARVLGAAEYGLFAYVLGLAAFFTVFADIGLNSILTREVAKKPKEDSYYFATIFWIKTVLLFFTAALIIFIAPHFSKIEGVRILLPFVALLTAFDGIRELTSAFFRAKEKMELEAVLITVTNVAITIFGLIILYFAASARTLAITYVLSAGTGTVVGAVILRKQFKKIISFFRKSLVRPILSSAWPIALLGIMGVFMLNIDIVMLGFFRTIGEVGFYSASQKIVTLLYTIPALLAASLFPVFARFVGKQENAKLKLLMERGITTTLLIAIPIVVGGIILGKEFIKLLYGTEYLPAALALQILFLTLFMAFPGSLVGNYIFVHDKQKKMAPNVAFGSLSNIILNIILIPAYGIMGAAAATVASQVIYHGLNWRLAKKINNFFALRYLRKIAGGAAVMGFFAFILNIAGIHVLLNVTLSAFVYLGILVLLKERALLEIKSALQI